MKFIIFAFFLGVGITAAVYEFLNERKEKQIDRLVSKTFVDLLEGSTLRISERQKILQRDLTEAEKDKVFDEYYVEYKQNTGNIL